MRFSGFLMVGSSCGALCVTGKCSQLCSCWGQGDGIPKSALPRHHIGRLPSLSVRKSCRGEARDTKIVWLDLRKHEEQQELCANGSSAEGRAHGHRPCLCEWYYKCVLVFKGCGDAELPSSLKLERHMSSTPCHGVCKAEWLNRLVNSLTLWLHPQQGLPQSVWSTCPKLPWLLLLIFGVALCFLKITPMA